MTTTIPSPAVMTPEGFTRAQRAAYHACAEITVPDIRVGDRIEHRYHGAWIVERVTNRGFRVMGRRLGRDAVPYGDPDKIPTRNDARRDPIRYYRVSDELVALRGHHWERVIEAIDRGEPYSQEAVRGAIERLEADDKLDRESLDRLVGYDRAWKRPESEIADDPMNREISARVGANIGRLNKLYAALED